MPDQLLPSHLPAERQVVIMLTDMVQYSKITYNLSPMEICEFITKYHDTLRQIVLDEEFRPSTIDPLAGDGSIIIFEKREGESAKEVCTRAVQCAVKMSYAIERNELSATRIGIFLGDIIEARLGKRYHKFGSSFAVASRLEALCGYFGTTILMDREVSRNQLTDKEFIVSIGKVTPKNFSSPFNLYSYFRPGINGCPKHLADEVVIDYIQQKNDIMERFCGNLLTGEKPDFPYVRSNLTELYDQFQAETGYRDQSAERILEYIRDQPYHEKEFERTGIQLNFNRDTTNKTQIVHLSKQLLRALDSDLYLVLIENTTWEKYFKLMWKKAGDIIFYADESVDGIYYIDKGSAEAIDSSGKVIAKFQEGSIFGEIAYFTSQKKRTATVIARTDLVLRKISISDFERLPEIQKLLRRLAERRTFIDQELN